MLFHELDFAPAAAAPAIDKDYCTQAFVKAHGQPYAYETIAHDDAKDVGTKGCCEPHGDESCGDRPFDVACCLQ